MPTNHWNVTCVHCAFEGSASTRELAERLGEMHESATNHSTHCHPPRTQSPSAGD